VSALLPKREHKTAKFNIFEHDLPKSEHDLGVFLVTNVDLRGYILIYEHAHVKKTVLKSTPGVSFLPISC
jgi:hypothetical protein